MKCHASKRLNLGIVALATLCIFISASAASANQWLDGSFKQHNGVCSDLFGTYNMIVTMESTGYYGALDGSYPKVNDVYYVHLLVGNVAAFPCSGQLLQLELKLPPNTTAVPSAAYPIQCIYTNMNTGAQENMAKGTHENYSCPSTAAAGSNGGVNLGWVQLPRSGSWDVWLPVQSTAQLRGMASANDKLVGYVNMMAGDGSGTTSPEAWVTTGAPAPSISYPNPSYQTISATQVRSTGYTNTRYIAGDVYMDISTSSAFPAGTTTGTIGPSHLDGASELYTSYSDWNMTGQPLNSTWYWRIRYVPVTGSPVIGAAQSFVYTGSTSQSGFVVTTSASPSEGGMVTGGGVYSGGTATLTATANPGYVFAEWTITSAQTSTSTANPHAVTMTGHVSAVARFSPTMPPVSGANLGVTTSGPSVPVIAGGNLTYSVTVTNNGPTDATGVVLTDTLPAGVTFVSATPGSPTCTQAAGVVTCNLGTIANSASSTVAIVVTTSSAGTLNNQATVSSAVTDPVSMNNSIAFSSVVAASANITLAAGANAPATASTAAKGAANAPMVQLVVSAATGTENFIVGKVTVQAGGTGNDVSDVTAVKLYLDENSNGVVDAGESLLSSGTYSTDNGTLDLVLSTALTVPAGTSKTMLLTYDFNATLASAPFSALPFAAVPLVFAGIMASRRTRYLLFALLLTATMAGVYSCGGGGGGGGADTPAANPDPDPNPGGGAVQSSTYQVTINSVVGKEAVSGAVAAVAGLPIAGTTVTVNK